MLGQTLTLKNLPKTGPDTLCILRLSAIGDVCHAVAMVQHIQRHWPATKITWVIGKVEHQLLKHLDNVEFVIFDKKQGLQAYKQLYRSFQGRKFDILLHMQVALRASIASLCIPAKIKLGFDKQRAKEAQWLFTNAQIAPQQAPHVLDGFMGFATAMGLPQPDIRWHIPIKSEDELWASEHYLTEKPLAILCPAASKAVRNWTVDGYAETARYLAKQGFTVAICGGPTAMEKQLATDIIATAKIDVINMVGKTTLLQLLAFLKLAHIVIAPDTGPAHMAVTVGTPVVGLYAHSNPLRTGPYVYQKYVVSYYAQAIMKEYKQAVNDVPWGTRAKGEQLMTEISLANVISKIDLLIADFYPELRQTL